MKLDLSVPCPSTNPAIQTMWQSARAEHNNWKIGDPLVDGVWRTLAERDLAECGIDIFTNQEKEAIWGNIKEFAFGRGAERK